MPRAPAVLDGAEPGDDDRVGLHHGVVPAYVRHGAGDEQRRHPGMGVPDVRPRPVRVPDARQHGREAGEWRFGTTYRT